ncbi:MAG: arylsulfatase [Planctomycetes bacterium]|nr:arylsulfatase [Planctomycetota bacterium]
MTHRCVSMWFTSVIVALMGGLGRAAPAAERPNIVVILADDQGWGDLSASGNSNLATPNIDSLAAQSVTFDRFFVCPVCSPTRAEFLTGRYHPRGGVRGVSTGGERLNLDEKTIADAFKAAGYATGAFGKWHNGTQYPYHPNGRGFDEFYGFTSGHWGTYFDPPLDHNGRPVRGKGFIIDDLTDQAIDFLERNKDRPFFCYVPYNTPHSPMQVPDRFWGKFGGLELKMRADRPADEDVAHTRAALAMCENIDWNVGRILGKLDELKLADRTVVIYFSDNGPNGWRWNGGMKGRKGSTDEGGVRSPFFIRWTGHLPAGRRIAQIAGAIDLLPTLTDLAGVPVAGSKPLDGLSLKPLLADGAGPVDWPDRMIFSHWAGRVSVRTQRYRLDDAGHLFDMEADPGQRHDVSRENADVAARLSKSVDDWRKQLLAGLKQDDRPYPVGYPQFPVTQLPARDGVPHGNVQRSASAPNCSYFKNFTSLDDSITWDVEVATAGEYEAMVYYTCPPADVGSTIELSCNGSRLEGKVLEAHDPPLAGAEHDRVPRRGESYVKEFKPLRLGSIRLKPGRAVLTLRPLSIPGSRVMEVRMLELVLR